MQRNRLIIIITVLIILAIIALLRIQVKEPAPTVEKKKVVNEEPLMKGAVMGLYDGYEKCTLYPPEGAAGQVSTYCQTHSSYASKNFVNNLVKGGTATAGGDPITCGQNLPTSVVVETVNPSQHTVEVVGSFGGNIETNIKVTLVKEMSNWKVDNIICPTP